MTMRHVFALGAASILALLPLSHCKPFEIHCNTVDNCEQGQICVAGLCQDPDGGTPDGGTTGTGGSSGTGGSTATGGSSGTGGTSSMSSSGSASCSPACAAPKPYCVGSSCVQCTAATQGTDCPGEKCCSNGTCSLLMACL